MAKKPIVFRHDRPALDGKPVAYMAVGNEIFVADRPNIVSIHYSAPDGAPVSEHFPADTEAGAVLDPKPMWLPEEDQTAPVFTKAWFKAKTGLSGSHISNMMKAAKVKRAARGDKNHQWTEKEAARTLRYIVAHSQNESVRERAKTALSEITP